LARKTGKKNQAGAISQEYAIVPVDSLETHPRNVNQGDIGAIYESIGANGFYGAIVARRARGGYLLVTTVTRRPCKGYQAAVQAGLGEVEGLLGSKWLDPSDEHRLLVHDWHEHADDATQMALKRKKLRFLTQCPDGVPTVAEKSAKSATVSGLPEPVPVPEPEPEPESVPRKPSARTARLPRI
jgi:hypothetical protein